jgi:hypothetical protein
MTRCIILVISLLSNIASSALTCQGSITFKSEKALQYTTKATDYLKTKKAAGSAICVFCAAYTFEIDCFDSKPKNAYADKKEYAKLVTIMSPFTNSAYKTWTPGETTSEGSFSGRNAFYHEDQSQCLTPDSKNTLKDISKMGFALINHSSRDMTDPEFTGGKFTKNSVTHDVVYTAEFSLVIDAINEKFKHIYVWAELRPTFITEKIPGLGNKDGPRGSLATSVGTCPNGEVRDTSFTPTLCIGVYEKPHTAWIRV